MIQKTPNQIKLTEYMFNDQYILSGISVASILIITQILISGLYIWRMPPEIPFFYSLITGADQLASSVWLMSIPIISILSLGLTWLFIRTTKDILITFHQIISWFSALIMFLGTISLIHVIVLVY